MSFQEIPLNGEEKEKLQAKNINVFLDIVAYEAIDQQTFDSLNSDQQQELIAQLDSEKWSILRSYLAEIDQAKAKKDVASDVQTATAWLATEAVVSPVVKQLTPEQEAKIKADAAAASQEWSSDDSSDKDDSAAWTEKQDGFLDALSLPITPNTAISVLRLMTYGYYPVQPTAKWFFVITDTSWIGKASQWLQKPQNLARARREDIMSRSQTKRQTDIEHATGQLMDDMKTSLANQAHAVVDEMERQIKAVPGVRDIKTHIDGLRAIVNDPHFGPTNTHLNNQLIEWVKQVIRFAGLTEKQVFNKTWARWVALDITQKRNAADLARTTHAWAQSTAESLQSIAKSDKAISEGKIQSLNNDIAHHTQDQKDALDKYNAIFSADPNLQNYSDIQQTDPNKFKDLTQIDTDTTKSITELDTKIGTITDPNSVAWKIEDIDRKIAAMWTEAHYVSTHPDLAPINTKIWLLNTQVAGVQSEIAKVNGQISGVQNHITSILIAAGKTPPTFPAWATPSEITAWMLSYALSEGVDQMKVMWLQNQLNSLEDRLFRFENNLHWPNGFQTELTKFEEKLDAKKAELKKEYSDTLKVENDKKTPLEEQKKDLEIERKKLVDKLGHIRSFLAAPHASYNNFLTRFQTAHADLLRAQSDLSTEKTNVSGYDRDIAKHADTADKASKNLVKVTDDHIRFSGQKELVDRAVDRVNQKWHKTVFNTLLGRGLSSDEANKILSISEARSRNSNIHNALLIVEDPSRTKAEKQQALGVVQNEILADAKAYERAKQRIDKIIDEANQKKQAIMDEIHKVENTNLTPAEIEVKKKEIINKIKEFNVFVKAKNKILQDQSHQIQWIHKDLIHAIENVGNPLKDSKLASGARTADKFVSTVTDPVTNRAGQAMLFWSTLELGAMWIQAARTDDKTKRNEALKDAWAYTLDAAVGAAAFVPWYGQLAAVGWDASMVTKMMATGTDIAWNPITTTDIVMRWGMAALGVIPFVWAWGRSVLLAKWAQKWAAIVDATISGTNIVQKWAIIGMAWSYFSSKLNMWFVDVGSWNVDKVWTMAEAPAN